MWRSAVILLACTVLSLADDAQKIVRISQSLQDLVRQHAVKGFNDGPYAQQANLQYRYLDEVITQFDAKGDMHTFDIIFLETNCDKNEVSHEQLIEQGHTGCGQRGATPTRVKCDNVKILWRQSEDYKNVLPITMCTPFFGSIEYDEDIPNINDDHSHIIKWRAFEKWRQAHEKEYSTKEEHLYRFEVFKENLLKIKQLQRAELGSATYGINRFGDMTEAEFIANMLPRDWDLNQRPEVQALINPEWLKEMPANFDWRNHTNPTIVTGVKNQGVCGSCWAFSVTGNVEGQWAIQKGNLVSLSEQELVDCDKLDDGCSGGLPTNAYKEIIRMGGLEGETDYPYTGRDATCNLKKKEIKVYINDSVAISTNETEMAAWLFKNGPISIGLNANAMMWYWSGIAHPWTFFCSPSNINHGVLLVGYGVSKKNEPFWIIKNSWGSWWGEKGYYRLYRGQGVCGVNTMATSAVIY